MAPNWVDPVDEPTLLTPGPSGEQLAAGQPDRSTPPVLAYEWSSTRSTLPSAGIHPKVVSERLGHASVAFTLDTYLHAIPAMQETAAELVASHVFER